MKTLYRFSGAAALAFLACLFVLMTNVSVSYGSSQFPEGTVVVPMGTAIEISDDAKIVTIYEPPVSIKPGDTFIVYLQDLPIGYKAVSVEAWDERLEISVEKADPSVYSQLSEEGKIELTSDMYEFIPAEGVRYSTSHGLHYKDERLYVSVEVYEGIEFQVGLTNLYLSHAFSGTEVSVSLSGNWDITIESSEEGIQSLNQSIGDDHEVTLELGEMRIAGVGKVELVLGVKGKISISASFEGTFTAGLIVNDEAKAKVNKDFNVISSNFQVRGSVAAGLKIKGGFDIIVAEADIYAEIGLKSVYSQMMTPHHDENHDPKDWTVVCDDVKAYLYTNVGAEALYHTPSGEDKIFASARFELLGERQSPIMINIHYENGNRVYICSEGMDTTTIEEPELGGLTSDFGSTLTTDGRSRYLETNVVLPYDITVQNDYRIESGELDLNGHTLTINGDLIQSGGKLTVRSGTLIVHGDYRFQSEANGVYGDSTGSLNMGYSEGTIIVDGDLILQTTSSAHSLSNGTIRVKGNIAQNMPVNGVSKFNTGINLNLILSAENPHVMRFDDSVNNSLGQLTLENDAVVNSGLKIYKANLKEHTLTVNGNLDILGTYNDTVLNGGKLTVNGDAALTGNLYLQGGEFTVSGNLVHSYGKLHIGGGKATIGSNYYLVGADSRFTEGNENYTQGQANLTMENANDILRIGGNLISNIATGYRIDFQAGVLYIGGDFTNYYGSISVDVKHKTVFTNPDKIRIQNSSFGQLEVQSREVTLKNSVNWLKLLSDLDNVISDGWSIPGNADFNTHNVSVQGNVQISGFSETIQLNRGKLAVSGNAALKGNLYLHGGEFTVSGNLVHSYGKLHIGGGEATIGGNHYLVGADSRFTEGNENYTMGQGSLTMENANDILRIGGNLISNISSGYSISFNAGVLYIGGDFTNYYGSISVDVKHKTVFTNPDKIRIQNGSFGQLEIQSREVTLKNSVNWLKLLSDLDNVISDGWSIPDDANFNTHNVSVQGDVQISGFSETIQLNGGKLAVSGNAALTGNLYLQGGKFTVSGNLVHSYGKLHIGGGKATIGGNYYIVGADSRFNEGNENYTMGQGSLTMENANDVLRIGGNFISNISSGYSISFRAGVLYIGGDFTNYYGSISVDVNHKTVLTGKGIIHVNFNNSEGKFGTLEIRQPFNMYEFNPNPCWIVINLFETPAFGEPGFVLPVKLQEIKAYAFSGIGAESVEIPETCVSIGAYAFSDSKVEKVRIPENCTIADTAFEDITDLFMFGIPGSPAETFCNQKIFCTFVEE